MRSAEYGSLEFWGRARRLMIICLHRESFLMMLRETCWLIHFVAEGDLTRIHVKVGWCDDHVWQLREVIFLSHDDHGSLTLTVTHYLRR
jgi:hypothetical protein